MPGAPDSRDKPPGGPDFDVVLVHGQTGDGEGARVLRARPGKLEAGEVRPMKEGRALTPGGEVVSLAPRADAPMLFDVKSSFRVPGAAGGSPSKHEETASAHPAASRRPAQVASRAYRESWERTFGAPRKGRELN